MSDATTAAKPAWKTTEFYLSILAILVGLLMGAGIIGDATVYAKVGGWVVAALGAAGYQWAATLANAAKGTGAPGWKSPAFYKTVAVSILIWFQSHGVIPEGSQWAELVGYALVALTGGSYAVSRGALKSTPAAYTWTSVNDLMVPDFAKDPPKSGAAGFTLVEVLIVTGACGFVVAAVLAGLR
jgi:hypothetical protein